LLSMACLGAYYLYRLGTRKRCNCPLCDNTYIIKEKLGSGGFGSVYIVEKSTGIITTKSSTSTTTTNKTNNNTASSYVLKQIYVEDIKEANESQKEARELRYLSHPRIVHYYDDFLHYSYSSYFSNDIHQALYVCIIMEQCSGGDIKQRISKIRKLKTTTPSINTVINNATEITIPNDTSTTSSSSSTVPPASSIIKIPSQHHIPEYLIARWTTQIATALKYCHSKGVCHRDIKSQNIFLTDNDDVRLGDFGLAKTFLKHKPVTAYSDAGTDVYKSPETFLGGKRDGRKADIWSFGLVLLELTTNVFTWERKEGCIGARVLPSPPPQPTQTTTAVPQPGSNNVANTTTNGIINNSKSGTITETVIIPPLIENLLNTIPTDIYSPQLRLLIKKCLIPDPDLRPSAEELFRFKLLRYGQSNYSLSNNNTITSTNNSNNNSFIISSSVAPPPAPTITNTLSSHTNSNILHRSTILPTPIDRNNLLSVRKPLENPPLSSSSSQYDSEPSMSDRSPLSNKYYYPSQLEQQQRKSSIPSITPNTNLHDQDSHGYDDRSDPEITNIYPWKSVKNYRNNRTIEYNTTDKDESLPPPIRNRHYRRTSLLPKSTEIINEIKRTDTITSNPFGLLATESPKVKKSPHSIRKRKTNIKTIIPQSE